MHDLLIVQKSKRLQYLFQYALDKLQVVAKQCMLLLKQVQQTLTGHVLDQNVELVVFIVVPARPNSHEMQVLHNAWVLELPTDVELVETADKRFFAFFLVLEYRNKLVHALRVPSVVKHFAQVHRALRSSAQLLVQFNFETFAGSQRSLEAIRVKYLNGHTPVGKPEQMLIFHWLVRLCTVTEDVEIVDSVVC